jgi:hypothetical protein
MSEEKLNSRAKGSSHSWAKAYRRMKLFLEQQENDPFTKDPERIAYIKGIKTAVEIFENAASVPFFKTKGENNENLLQC